MADPLDSEPSFHGSSPDIMNDPQYATNTGDVHDENGDADTCRICRGDGSTTEPLFHPCKCSGSIKFVHQDCLIDWLSHSQKKHCELCKTPFRFTKLYSPNMPQYLPLHLLVHHLCKNLLKNFATWLRFAFVITVWLGCLPYAIRQVWTFLFWFSDGGWPPTQLGDTTLNLTVEEAKDMAYGLDWTAVTGNETSPVISPFQSNQTTPANVAGIADKLLHMLKPLSKTLNITEGDPLAAGFFKYIYYGLGIESVGSFEDGATKIAPIDPVPDQLRSQSLLSDVSFLNNMFRTPFLNRLAITIAEGYIITILVVFCFILVFLIREWVVQQQPGINMGAGFDADFAPRDAPADPEPAVNLEGPRELGLRPIARPRRRNLHVADGDGALQGQPRNAGQEPGMNLQADTGPTPSRPAPARDALSPAAEIQRRLVEERRDEPRMTEEFLAIWRRADSNPQEVLRIIEQENLGNEMRYWVNAMKVLQHPINPESESSQLPEPSISHPQHDPTTVSNNIRTRRPSPRLASDASSINTHLGIHDNSFQDSAKTTHHPIQHRHPNGTFPELIGYQPETSSQTTPIDKGKGKATETSPGTNPVLQDEDLGSVPSHQHQGSSRGSLVFGDEKSFSLGSSRPRAASDGPRPREVISPLAYNNWTFANLPMSSDERAISRGQDSNDAERLTQPIASSSNLPRVESFLNKASEIQDWKAAQDLRVKGAITSAREAQKTALNIHDTTTSLPGVSNVHIQTDIPVESEDAPADVFDASHVVIERNQGTTVPGITDFEHVQEQEPIPLVPDAVHNDPPGPLMVHAPRPHGILDAVADYLWGGIGNEVIHDPPAENDEHVVQDFAAEAPFVPVAHHDALGQDGEIQDREVADAAIAAGVDPDPDVVDDAEDFEGIMELVGMRGPISGLLQNALFSAFLLALTVAFGVWIPYNIGRVALLLTANPGPAFKLPLKIIFGFAALIQDFAMALLGLSSYGLVTLSSFPVQLWCYLSAYSCSTVLARAMTIGNAALRISIVAFTRIQDGALDTLLHITDSEIFTFSAASHESLIAIKSLLVQSISGIGSIVVCIFTGNYRVAFHHAVDITIESFRDVSKLAVKLPDLLLDPNTWVISLEIAERSVPLDLELSVWGGMDRFWAVAAGYTSLCFLAGLYLKKGTLFSSSQAGREWETFTIDLLNQAGGVMKVILIISIEMLLFPLYCGLLLDVALLPLFDNATITSRILFTIKSPLTSIFVHWFVGTCYMFHFALFVSMCRKIMRKGVLYFIRDPDDPTFHPVRDVLERNVATQLRKILFSALVYGALVVVCLGGVVWGLTFALQGVLPIHWSSNEPVLEFPIDLLFYNFLMPLAVRVFKPSEGLHTMYSWWFRQCARMLRLTWFLFDERRMDEEGYHVQRTWSDVARGIKGDPLMMIKTDDVNQPFADDPNLSAYFRPDGRYVRAPASDQVRIPKGTQIFLQVDEHNNRVDGVWDLPDGIHGRNSGLYKHLYIPPWFKVRILVFILSIWIFAALTGVGITIIPLVFGRQVFAILIPPHVRKNDVYAFSIGIYILGSVLYAALNLRRFVNYVRQSLTFNSNTPQNVLRRIATVASFAAGIAWTYAAFLIILPTLFAFLVELYFIVPLHTYFAFGEPHVMHFVQSWTLGLLYVKLTTRFVLWHEDSRAAQSLRAITRNGYLNPDAKLATRSFILPVSLAACIALLIPWALAQAATTTVLKAEPETHILAYRYSYPLFFALGCIAYAFYMLVGLLKDWRMIIRDEVYLIGERLHNFGDRKGANVVVQGQAHGLRRIDT